MMLFGASGRIVLFSVFVWFDIFRVLLLATYAIILWMLMMLGFLLRWIFNLLPVITIFVALG